MVQIFGDAIADKSVNTTGPLYLKSMVQVTNLSFYYSLDNKKWTLVNNAPYTDTTYSTGTVQIAWGVGACSNLDVYFDNLTFTNL